MIPNATNKTMQRSSSTKDHIKKNSILPWQRIFKQKKTSVRDKRLQDNLFTISGKSLIKDKSMKLSPLPSKELKEVAFTQTKNTEPTILISQIFGSCKDLRPPHKSPIPCSNPSADSSIFSTLPLSFNQINNSKPSINMFQILRRKNSTRMMRKVKTPF